jgi:hypothetical protein
MPLILVPGPYERVSTRTHLDASRHTSRQ